MNKLLRLRQFAYLLFALVLCWAAPDRIHALPASTSLDLAVTDVENPTQFNFSLFDPTGDPLSGEIFWQLSLSGSCTDALRDGCSVTPGDFPLALAQLSIEGVAVATIGTGVSFPLPGTNLFDFGTVSGSYLCPVSCDVALLQLSFTGSGFDDTTSLLISASFSSQPFSVPEPTSLAMLAIGLAGLIYRRRRN